MGGFFVLFFLFGFFLFGSVFHVGVGVLLAVCDFVMLLCWGGFRLGSVAFPLWFFFVWLVLSW